MGLQDKGNGKPFLAIAVGARRLVVRFTYALLGNLGMPGNVRTGKSDENEYRRKLKTASQCVCSNRTCYADLR